MNILLILVAVAVAVGTMKLCSLFDRWDDMRGVMDNMHHHKQNPQERGEARECSLVTQLQNERMSQLDIWHLRDVRFRELNEKRKTPRPTWMKD